MDIPHIKRLLYYWTWLFSLLELDPRYDWWVIAPNTHHSLFLVGLKSNLKITWKVLVVCGRSAYQTTALLSETFLVLYRVAWEIRLESYDPRHISIVLWYNIVVHILQACAYIAIWCTTMHDNKTHVPYDCILHKNNSFTANNASFYKNKVG